MGRVVTLSLSQEIAPDGAVGADKIDLSAEETDSVDSGRPVVLCGLDEVFSSGGASFRLIDGSSASSTGRDALNDVSPHWN